MKPGQTFGQPPTEQDRLKQQQRELRLVRSGKSIVEHLSQGRFDKALGTAVSSGIKLASDKEPFKDPLTNPLKIFEELKTLGINALAWKPETLMAAIDRKYYGWTDDQVATALEHFHSTGDIKTNVPSLLRQKIYAIRIIVTTDVPHNEWSIFEKVGCAFNDRAVHFGLVERLSMAECAKTIALIEHIRPDTYSEEVRTYIAACCHEDGLLTAAPSKYLFIIDKQLQELNAQTAGGKLSLIVEDRIRQKLEYIKQNTMTAVISAEVIEDNQALKLFAADSMADQAIAGF